MAKIPKGIKIVNQTKSYKPYPESKLCDPMKSYQYGEVWSTLDGQMIPIVNLRNNHLMKIREHILKRHVQGYLKYIDAEIERRKKAFLIKNSKAGKILYERK